MCFYYGINEHNDLHRNNNLITLCSFLFVTLKPKKALIASYKLSIIKFSLLKKNEMPDPKNRIYYS